jgi:hypothetical protein
MHNFDCQFISEKGEFKVFTGYANHPKLSANFMLI